MKSHTECWCILQSDMTTARRKAQRLSSTQHVPKTSANNIVRSPCPQPSGLTQSHSCLLDSSARVQKPTPLALMTMAQSHMVRQALPLGASSKAIGRDTRYLRWQRQKYCASAILKTTRSKPHPPLRALDLGDHLVSLTRPQLAVPVRRPSAAAPTENPELDSVVVDKARIQHAIEATTRRLLIEAVYETQTVDS